MFILGILSLVQIVFLPGLISLRLIRFRGSFLQRVIYTFALSLLMNYCLVFLLTALKLYSHWVVIVLFAAQVIWAIWLYGEDLRKPLLEVFQNLWDTSTSSLAEFFPSSPDHFSRSQKAVHYIFLIFTLISLVFALDRLWWSFGVFLNNIGSIFDGWDAVYSYNRWAEVWFSGKIPLDSRFYPQLIPINWSLTYVFIGEATVQLFAKSIMPMFIIGILLQLFDLGITFQQPGYFVAIILSRALFLRFIKTGIDNGLVDIAVAFFALLPFYTLIKAQATKTESEQRTLWILGFFFAAAATVTKQPGVYIFLIYPILVYVTLLRPTYGNWLNPLIRQKVLIWGAIAALIPLFWYGFKLALISQGVDSSEIIGNVGFAAQAYGNVGVGPQIMQALQKFGVYLILFPLIVCALPGLPSLIRWLFALFILPFPIVWALMASYDGRNLAIVLPALALAGGLSIEVFFRLLLRLLALVKIEKWTTILIPAVSLVVLFVLANYYTDHRVRVADSTARQELFSPSLNRELRHLYSDAPNTLILTNYPVAYILERKNTQVSFWYADAQEFERQLQNDKITHLLVPSGGVSAEITKRIEQMINDDYLSLVLEDKGSTVTLYKLYVIRR
jgi:hypothetical protein